MSVQAKYKEQRYNQLDNGILFPFFLHESFAAFFLHLTCQVRRRDQPERCLCETSPIDCTLIVDCFSVYSLVNRRLINLFQMREIVAAMHLFPRTLILISFFIQPHYITYIKCTLNICIFT